MTVIKGTVKLFFDFFLLRISKLGRANYKTRHVLDFWIPAKIARYRKIGHRRSHEMGYTVSLKKVIKKIENFT